MTPNNWQWNVSLEHEIARNTTLELSYVGSKGNDLLRSSDINQVRSGDNDGDGVEDRLEYARSNPADASVRPISAFGDRRINYWDHSGNSVYHGLQTQIVSRFGRGSHFQASYTWSRTIANDPLDNSSGSIAARRGRARPRQPRLDRGLANVDRRHIFNTSLVLVLPTFEEKSGFVKHVLRRLGGRDASSAPPRAARSPCSPAPSPA